MNFFENNSDEDEGKIDDEYEEGELSSPAPSAASVNNSYQEVASKKRPRGDFRGESSGREVPRKKEKKEKKVKKKSFQKRF